MGDFLTERLFGYNECCATGWICDLGDVVTDSRMEVNVLKGMLDRSFYEDPALYNDRRWHSVISNLEPVRPEDWDALPEGAERPIRELVNHVGKCYLIYENHCFGDGTLTWNAGAMTEGLPRQATPEQTIDWLRASHRKFSESLAKITDEQLGEAGTGDWFEGHPRRDIVERMIQHGIYHAGEINHLRGTIQRNDAWG
jgi:uncharacterized damage-inducible protein DinB